LGSLVAVFEFEGKEVGTQPDTATIFRPPANTQQRASASQVKVAISVPVAKSRTFSVCSSETETACFPSGVTATHSHGRCGREYDRALRRHEFRAQLLLRVYHVKPVPDWG
jgi:hypothetical protein